MKTSKLFVYGQLKPGSKYEIHSLTKPEKAKIDASMYQLKGDAAIKKLGNSSHEAKGYVVSVPTATLSHFDKEEKPQFKRERTCTLNGEKVWVYAYKDKVSKKDKIIKNFKVKK